jgi:hypothetical protein
MRVRVENLTQGFYPDFLRRGYPKPGLRIVRIEKISADPSIYANIAMHKNRWPIFLTICSAPTFAVW